MLVWRSRCVVRGVLCIGSFVLLVIRCEDQWSGVIVSSPQDGCVMDEYQISQIALSDDHQRQLQKPIMISIRLLLREDQLFETRGTKFSPSALCELLSLCTNPRCELEHQGPQSLYTISVFSISQKLKTFPSLFYLYSKLLLRRLHYNLRLHSLPTSPVKSSTRS